MGSALNAERPLMAWACEGAMGVKKNINSDKLSGEKTLTEAHEQPIPVGSRVSCYGSGNMSVNASRLRLLMG
jgi:hypothetical protein